ncbi:hypothetical protein TWF694_010887 [Orbilia ellipsospora]|uniref:Aminoglycoside phosphotransferase domain-containing protein n=1 Tax=Orbilia ellipsospora TaxID=2528407 RepID=A0AAV9X8B8_9PEZI
MPTTTADIVPKIEALFERHIHQRPTRITTPRTSGLFNLLYLVTLPSPPSGFSSTEYFLRLSHPLHPSIKTRNEVGWLQYIHQHGTPSLSHKVPKLLFYSSTTEELDYEYTVLEKLHGETLCDIWEEIDPSTLVSAVVDVAQEIRNFTSKLPRRWFGGFTPEFEPGPYVEYTLYPTDHIEKHWSAYPDETYGTLNIAKPYDTLTEYWKARMERDIRIVEKHDRCASLRPNFLQALKSLPDIPEAVNKAEPFLTHRDLILGNLLWSREEQKITGILDWEFAGMYTLSDWNPGNTLWTTTPQKNKDGKVTQELLFNLFDEELQKRGMNDDDPIFKEGTREHHYARVISLSYWIVRKHVEQDELEESGRVATWLEKFYEHCKILALPVNDN